MSSLLAVFDHHLRVSSRETTFFNRSFSTLRSRAIIPGMGAPVPTPGELEKAFKRAHELQTDLVRRERAVGRRIQALARGLAAVMEPGEFFHRIGVGLHAFDVDGTTCLAASYLEEDGDGYRYRYAVLCGGEAARRALRNAALDPSDSDEPGPTRRVALATYPQFDDFLYRLPKYLGDVNRRIEAQLGETTNADRRIREGRRLVAATRRKTSAPGAADQPGRPTRAK